MLTTRAFVTLLKYRPSYSVKVPAPVWKPPPCIQTITGRLSLGGEVESLKSTDLGTWIFNTRQSSVICQTQFCFQLIVKANLHFTPVLWLSRSGIDFFYTNLSLGKILLKQWMNFLCAVLCTYTRKILPRRSSELQSLASLLVEIVALSKIVK